MSTEKKLHQFKSVKVNGEFYAIWTPTDTLSSCFHASPFEKVNAKVPIPEGVQETCRRGTSGCGLAGMVVLGWRLDLMILEVFSNLWLYDKAKQVNQTETGEGLHRLN